jgi:hypothetical protein
MNLTALKCILYVAWSCRAPAQLLLLLVLLLRLLLRLLPPPWPVLLHLLLGAEVALEAGEGWAGGLGRGTTPAACGRRPVGLPRPVLLLLGHLPCPLPAGDRGQQRHGRQDLVHVDAAGMCGLQQGGVNVAGLVDSLLAQHIHQCSSLYRLFTATNGTCHQHHAAEPLSSPPTLPPAPRLPPVLPHKPAGHPCGARWARSGPLCKAGRPARHTPLLKTCSKGVGTPTHKGTMDDAIWTMSAWMSG